MLWPCPFNQQAPNFQGSIHVLVLSKRKRNKLKFLKDNLTQCQVMPLTSSLSGPHASVPDPQLKKNNSQMKNKNSTADQTLQMNLKVLKSTVQLIKFVKHMGVTCLKQVCSTCINGYFPNYYIFH